MQVYKLTMGAVILRFYLMMMVVIAAGFIGQWWLAVLALPILLSIMLGVSFTDKKEQGTRRSITQGEKSYKKAG